MGEKISTVILKVDLACHRCCKKICRAICKLQERMNINTIAFDEKNNTVAIAGLFDPRKLCQKLCCRASDVIKDIQINEQNSGRPKEMAQPKKDKPKDIKTAEVVDTKDDKPKDVKPTQVVEPEKDEPIDLKPTEPVEPKIDKPQDAKSVESKEPKEDETKGDAKASEPAKPKDPESTEGQPMALEPALAKTEPVFVNQELEFQPEQIYLDQGPKFVYVPGCTDLGWGCGCGRRYEDYYRENQCCWCGRSYGWTLEGPPSGVYGASVYDGSKICNILNEEDPQSCSIM